MDEITFLKLGGSLITDKTQPYTIRRDKLSELAKEIKSALARTPELRVVIGHGSGSFGHYAVTEHYPQLEIREKKDWLGFNEVWYRASQLNRYVIEAFHDAGVPAMAIQPSASVISRDGAVEHWDLSPLKAALEAGIAPVIFGDMTFDTVKGGTVLSTEALMFHLAQQLRPQRILLAGLEAAVWADFPARHQRVEKVTPANYAAMAGKIGSSHGTDVTGGMKSKVEEMLRLVQTVPQVTIQIFSGEESGNVERVLNGAVIGTLIARD
ncbi:MAG: isopentenyl phosphate kinase [Chloroflexi bacterium]|nr:isopentenyl phosphate kinase [Chloroflexota bacterium]